MRISATRFENYNLCHFKFFCQNGLKIRQELKGDKRIRKRKYHTLLHGQLSSSCKTKEEFYALTKSQIVKQINDYAQEYREKELGGDIGKSQRFIVKFKKTVEGIVDLVYIFRRSLGSQNFDLLILSWKYRIDRVIPIRLKTKRWHRGYTDWKS